MITETELIRAAKTFRANCTANGDKISFADACKIVLLAEYFAKDHSPAVAKMIYQMVVDPRPWWKFW